MMLDLDRPLELPDAFRITRNESRREDYVRLSGRDDLTAADIQSLRHTVQMDLARRVRPPFLLKTHNARCVVGGVPIICDDLTLGAVYVVRNPLDVVDSAEHAALPVHLVRYEELLAATAATLRNVLTFLGWSGGWGIEAPIIHKRRASQILAVGHQPGRRHR